MELPKTQDPPISKEEEQKPYEIISDEYKRTYLLNLENLKKKIKFKVCEKDLFPANVYQNSYSLEELSTIYPYFKKFEDVAEVIADLNSFNDNKIFGIKLISKIDMKLLIEFPPEKQIEKMEIDLNKIKIDQREMIRQINEKYKELVKLHNDDLKKFNDRMRIIEEQMGIEHKEENNETSINDEVNNKNIEQMKNELKKEVKKNIAKNSKTKNMNNNKKVDGVNKGKINPKSKGKAKGK